MSVQKSWHQDLKVSTQDPEVHVFVSLTFVPRISSLHGPVIFFPRRTPFRKMKFQQFNKDTFARIAELGIFRCTLLEIFVLGELWNLGQKRMEWFIPLLVRTMPTFRALRISSQTSPDQLSDPDRTPLPMHQGIKYVTKTPCCEPGSV